MKLLSQVLLLLGLLLILSHVTHARNYAVIVSGSNGWWNYRHHADASHHYQMLIGLGFNPDDIITMLYKDVPYDRMNPFPGELYNNPHTKDVFHGVKVDYENDTVTPQAFLNVLSGNETSSTHGRRVLHTTEDDNIYVYFSDHGSNGLIAFPNDEVLLVDDFKNTLQYMKHMNKFKHLFISIEACNSGSFCNFLPNPYSPDDSDDDHQYDNILCLTASNETQSSWAYFCDGDDTVVKGQDIGTCLADEYSYHFMTRIETIGLDQTIGELAKYVTTNVNLSPVRTFGDKSMLSLSLGEILTTPDYKRNGSINTTTPIQRRRLGPSSNSSSSTTLPSSPSTTTTTSPKHTGKPVDSRDMALHSLMKRYLDRSNNLNDSQRYEAGLHLMIELQHRLESERLYHHIVEHVLHNNDVVHNTSLFNSINNSKKQQQQQQQTTDNEQQQYATLDATSNTTTNNAPLHDDANNDDDIFTPDIYDSIRKIKHQRKMHKKQRKMHTSSSSSVPAASSNSIQSYDEPSSSTVSSLLSPLIYAVSTPNGFHAKGAPHDIVSAIHSFNSPIIASDCGSCCKRAYMALQDTTCKGTDYSLKYYNTLHNLCTYTGYDNTHAVLDAIEHICQPIE